MHALQQCSSPTWAANGYPSCCTIFIRDGGGGGSAFGAAGTMPTVQNLQELKVYIERLYISKISLALSFLPAHWRSTSDSNPSSQPSGIRPITRRQSVWPELPRRFAQGLYNALTTLISAKGFNSGCSMSRMLSHSCSLLLEQECG